MVIIITFKSNLGLDFWLWSDLDMTDSLSNSYPTQTQPILSNLFFFPFCVKLKVENVC